MDQQQEIPASWIDPVVSILSTGDNNYIEWTMQARLDWQAATDAAWLFEAYNAMAAALRDSRVGLQIALPEEGETYAFWFYYSSRRLYGKICLRNSKVKIKIISAHTPRKGDVLS